MMIKQGNCLELLKDVPSGSVDLVVDDLPYGCTNLKQDVCVPLEPLWAEFKRITKKNATIVLFCQMNSCKVGELPFAAELIAKETIPFRYEWCWEKSLGVGFLNAKKMPLRCHENILVFYQKLPTYNPQFSKGKQYKHYRNPQNCNNYGRQKSHFSSNNGEQYYPRDVIYFTSTVGVEERFHPQQKPVELLEYLIKTYSNAGELVLDATMGSGSTGVAAINTGRKFIGFELDKGFFEIAKKRIALASESKAQELF